MTTPADSTATDSNAPEKTFEGVVQFVLGWIVDRVPIANNNEREWIKAHIDALFIDPNVPDPADVPAHETAPISVPGEMPPVPVIAGSGATQVNDGVTESAIAPETVTTVPTPDASGSIVDPEFAGYPASYPTNGSSDDIRSWYANATDADIAQVNAARAA